MMASTSWWPRLPVLAALSLPTIPGCGLNTFGLGNASATTTLAVTTTADTATTALLTGSSEATTPGTTTTEVSTTAVTTTGTTTTEALTTGCVPMTWYFDIDMDGYGGPQSTEKCDVPGPGYTLTSDDCNDSDETINPGAAEVCDMVDNDCDGGTDEYPAGAMTACNGCTTFVDNGSTYYFCSTPTRDWTTAQTYCTTLLGGLVIINTSEEQALIKSQFLQVKDRWWIGLSDTAVEGQFVWVDGAPLDPNLAYWGVDEPNDVDPDFPGFPANCAVITNDIQPIGTWRDQKCSAPKALICEAPAPS